MKERDFVVSIVINIATYSAVFINVVYAFKRNSNRPEIAVLSVIITSATFLATYLMGKRHKKEDRRRMKW